jgi:hypothetical protein
MKPLKTIAFILTLAPALVTLQAKPKQPTKLSAEFNQALYFYVEAIDGQEFDPQLYPEDRQAIADTVRAIQKWNRYTYVVQRDQADLIFVVRKGRVAAARVGIQGSPGPRGPAGPQSTPGQPTTAPGGGYGVGVGGEVGPADDLLEVYLATPDHALGAMVWQHTLPNGLDGPGVMLVQQLKDEVERTYPVQAASQSQNP